MNDVDWKQMRDDIQECLDELDWKEMRDELKEGIEKEEWDKITKDFKQAMAELGMDTGSGRDKKGLNNDSDWEELLL